VHHVSPPWLVTVVLWAQRIEESEVRKSRDWKEVNMKASTPEDSKEGSFDDRSSTVNVKSLDAE
jgi:hypothetical protein